MSLRLPDSGADTLPDGRRMAPSAARNLAPLLDMLANVAPATGRALELASGTGQHIAAFAAAHPGLDWQPTDVNPGNLASIRAWATDAACPNLRAPVLLDAGTEGWAAAHGGLALVVAINLLHLVPEATAETALSEAAAALAPGGIALFYGPFLRRGRATSEGDAAFDASLRAQDPHIGYKDAEWVKGCLARAGLAVELRAMPANNLTFLARKS